VDLATLKRQALLLPKDISVFIRGAHGIGKTELVYDIAEDLGLPVMQRRLSQLTEGDLIGLPDKKEKWSEFLPMRWFFDCLTTPHLIFLDEIDRALPEVIQAAFELCYDRTIQGREIHKDCRIYAAGNSGTVSNNYQVNSLDPAFLSRFWVADAEPNIEEWMVWAHDHGVHKEVIAFIEDESEHLEMKKGEKLKSEQVYPSRRSWVRLSSTIKQPNVLSQGEDDLKALCEGFIGFDASQSFVKFVKDENRIGAIDILNGVNKHSSKIRFMNIEEKTKLGKKLFKHGCLNKWSEEQVKNVIGFLEMLPDELKMRFHDFMTSLDMDQDNAQAYISRANKIMMEVARSK
jgi:hypothetical protein